MGVKELEREVKDKIVLLVKEFGVISEKELYVKYTSVYRQYDDHCFGELLDELVDGDKELNCVMFIPEEVDKILLSERCIYCLNTTGFHVTACGKVTEV